MTAIALLVVAQCLAPEDQTAGWKRTPLTAAMPALAAPPDVDQYRSGELTLVVDAEPRFVHHAVARTGRLVMSFSVPAGSQHLRVRFLDRLDGMRVEATAADSGGRIMPLLDGRRFPGDEVRLEWGAPDVVRIDVLLRHHLRRRPVVREWRSGQWERVSERLEPSAGSGKPGALYWRHPGGRHIELCNAPGQVLEVHRGASGTPAGLARLSHSVQPELGGSSSPGDSNTTEPSGGPGK